MFGHEHILEKKKRTYSVKCDSLDGILYFMRRKDFLALINDDIE